MNVRTDLAFEAREVYMESSADQIPEGVAYHEEEKEGFEVRRVRVENEQGRSALGKEVGNYITVHIPDVEFSAYYEKAAQVVSEEISALMTVDKDSSVLVIGLGNRNITADALGPKVVGGLVISRHLKDHMPELAENLGRVCALAPGVLGLTGIETGEIVMGIADRIKPTHVIAIDALASKSVDRIANTIQIADTGIVPGSGVGNHRKALTRETLGVPVLSIGVPTVVSVGVIARQTAQILADSSEIDQDKSKAEQELFSKLDEMVVTPKNIDLIMEKIAKIVSSGINLSIHKGYTLEEMEVFL